MNIIAAGLGAFLIASTLAACDGGSFLGFDLCQPKEWVDQSVVELPPTIPKQAKEVGVDRYNDDCEQPNFAMAYFVLPGTSFRVASREVAAQAQ